MRNAFVLLLFAGMAFKAIAQDRRQLTIMRHSLMIPVSVKAEFMDTTDQTERWRLIFGKDTLILLAGYYFQAPIYSHAWTCGTGDHEWRAGYGPGFCQPQFMTLPDLTYPADTAYARREAEAITWNEAEVQTLLAAKTVLLNDLEKQNIPLEFELTAFDEMYKIVDSYEKSSLKQDSISFSADYQYHQLRLDYTYRRNYALSSYSSQYIYVYGTIYSISTFGILNKILETLQFRIDPSLHY